MIPLSVSLASPMPGRDPTGDSVETPCPHATPQGAPMGAPLPAPPPALSIAPALPAASSGDGGEGEEGEAVFALPAFL